MNVSIDEKNCRAAISMLEKNVENLGLLKAEALNSARTLVVVVDMIKGFCVSGNLASDRCDFVAEPIRNLLEKLDKAERVFVCDAHSDVSQEFKSYPAHCHTAMEKEVVDSLKKFANKKVEKNSTNGFFSLKNSVNFNDYSDFIIVGVCSDICVLQLATTLKQFFNERDENKNVIALTDCMETFSSPDHDANFFNLAATALLINAGVSVFKNISE